MKSLKTYDELMSIEDFYDRFDYLKLNGQVGERTFGGNRYLNQRFYHSSEWGRIKSKVLVRDSGFDLGHPDFPINGHIYIHHINPVTLDDVLSGDPRIFDLQNLISVSHYTHEAIHFGDRNLLPSLPMDRFPGDTKLW